MTITRSVQHRCINMMKHLTYQRGERVLPVPCPDCYLLIVTAEEVPYRSNERRAEVRLKEGEA